MNWRPGYIPITLLLGLSAPMGCRNWECSPQQMTVPTRKACPGASGAGELSYTQAAQLCRSAGEELEKKGFIVEAIRQYENARKHDPQTPGLARHLAVLYDLQGNAAAAESEYLRALQEQPGNADLLNDFGYYHYRHHRLQLAETWLRKALSVDPQSACAWINLGRVLADQARVQESFQAFAHVLRPAEAYSNVGVLLAGQGRTAEASKALRQALVLDPGLEPSRAFLNALPSTPDPMPPSITRTAPPAPPLRTLPATAAAVSSDRPIIVNGSIRTTPTNYAPTSVRSALPSKAPLAPRTSPPASTPPPAVPHTSAVQESPILIRTSALLDEAELAEPSAPISPLPLPAMPHSTPLPSVPPQATLTDCQADPKPDSPSQSP